MKYPYKKSAFYGMIAFTVILIELMVFIFSDASVTSIIGSALLICALGATIAKDTLSRYVELLDDAVKFGSYSFRKKGHRYPDPPVTFEIPYEKIYVLEAKKLPLIGIWTISIDANGLQQNVLLEKGFANYNELVKNLCKRVKEYNPDVYIDPKLRKYIEK